MTTPSEILNAALALDSRQRADVTYQLLLSLEPPDFDDNADAAWAAEIRRRLQAIRAGQVVLRDWDDALSDIRRSLFARGQS
jgi:Putative addiction module component